MTYNELLDVDPKHPDVEVDLVGEDGNAFAILGRVSKALRRAGIDDASFLAEAMSGDYGHLLRTVARWVTVPEAPDEPEDD